MHRLARQWEALLPYVEKPGRYVGGEPHAVTKTLDQIKVHVGIVFPDIYEIGMSHNGIRILYELINRHDDSYAERVFAPWHDMASLLKQRELPLLTLESRTPLKKLDLVGFSLQTELNYSNIPYLLDLAQIPLFADQRRNYDPIIAAGGPTMCNPEPVADFFDFILIGDAEEAIEEMLQIFRDIPSRQRRLEALAQLRGFYVPQIHNHAARIQRNESIPFAERIKRRWVSDLNPANYPETPLVPVIKTVHDRVSVEVMRGCTQGCRYCQAGYFYRPAREMAVQDILKLAKKGIDATGVDELGLLSLSTADYSQVEPLTRAINQQFKQDKISISLPSLRADALSVKLADQAGEVRRSGFTFAPEAGSERLRRVINKNISDAEMLEAARIAFSKGWNLIKLYIMINLPTETRTDIKSIITLTENILGIAPKSGRPKRVHVSIGTFVPKPFTPFQWEPFRELAELEDHLRYLQENLIHRQTKLKWHEPKEAFIECVLSRGDRSVAKAIYNYYKNGHCFDSFSEHFNFAGWMRAFEESAVDPMPFIREQPMDKLLPWDFIHIGLAKNYLAKERQRAYAGVGVSDCKWGDCHHCGIPGNYKDIKLAPKVDRLDELIDTKPLENQAGNAIDPNTFTTLVLTYTKQGKLRWLGQRDMANLIERGLKQALKQNGLYLKYSQGYSPHAKLSFSPALPVGVASGYEQVQFHVLGELPEFIADKLLVQLHDFLPEELSAIEIHEKAVGENISKPCQSRFRLRQIGDELSVEQAVVVNSVGKRATQLASHKDQGDCSASLLENFILYNQNPLDVEFTLKWNSSQGAPPRVGQFLTQELGCPEIWSAIFALEKQPPMAAVAPLAKLSGAADVEAARTHHLAL